MLPEDLTGGTAWPPEEHATRVRTQVRHRVLWGNDPDELLATYPQLASIQRTGEDLVPYPSARILARTFAALLFGEDPRLSHADPQVLGAATALATAASLPTLGAEAAVDQAIEGEVWLRPSWAIDVDPRHTILDAVPGHRAFGTFRFGRPTAVGFVTTWNLSRKDDYLRHVELHAPGEVRHRLYRGTRSNLGTQQRLADWSQARGLDTPERVAAADLELVVQTGVERLLPVHVPLTRTGSNPAGLAAMDGVEPLALALHRLYTQEQHDAELARRRVAVTRSALGLQRGGRGTLGFDRDRDLFVIDDAEAGAIGSDHAPVTPIEFSDDTAMRERITSRLGDLLIAAGIAPATVLPDQTGNAPSGTSRRLAQSLTVATIALAARYWNRALSEVVTGGLLLERARGLSDAPSPEVAALAVADPVTATLADGMVDDPVELAGMVEQLARAEAASTQERVRRVNPTWSDDEVAAEVDRIAAESDVPPPPSPNGLADLIDEDELDGLLGG